MHSPILQGAEKKDRCETDRPLFVRAAERHVARFAARDIDAIVD